MKKFFIGDQVVVLETSEIGRVCGGVGTRTVRVKIAGVEQQYNVHEVELLKSTSLKMAVDPLIAATKKAYRASNQYKLDQLLDEESRWKRKVTIASNKLSDVRERINKLARELVKPEVKS